ncbi:hypothetical protein A3K86_02675 [Photobacterium jeanii]|uniref:Uncharacterized protein n=1 Tax=Photobacterium jeanii TaxID=858640 RepID=A0A178KMQ5_9GAMM|nr:hypothetical protein [Photobacterium jeanii]OAN17842.1 hypothetical protein A3K86_02675 [Photobacterium jeanii]PST92492.1 hypothetical protein C9I91_04795 [Photobacterium jeanii]
MNAKKALKNLKKQVVKKPTKAARQLMNIGLAKAQQVGNDPQLAQEMKGVSQQVVHDVVSELAVPLTPVLSWFQEGSSFSSSFDSYASSGESQGIGQIKSVRPVANQNLAGGSSGQGAMGQQGAALARLPLKSPPCKRCPAMSNGLCKCAMKKFNLSAA